MTIYLATNDINDFGGITDGVTTNTNFFDSTYVDSAIIMKTQDSGQFPTHVGHSFSVSGDNQAWVHFDLYMPTTNSSIVDGSFITWIDNDGNRAVSSSFVNGNLICTIYNGANANIANAIGFFLPAGLATYDMVYEDDGTNINFTIYVNGVIFLALTRAASATKRIPTSFTWDNIDAGLSGNFSYVSQLIMANESTIGMKLQSINPSAVGNYTNLSATVTEVTDGNQITGWIGETAADKQSFVTSGYSLPAGRIVHSVFPGFDLRFGPTGPQQIRPFVRIGGVDYNAPADMQPLPRTKRGLLGYAWTTNPATGLPWTGAEIAALEAGYELKA
ncbi:hypothetical protein vBRpoPV14_41 [Ruegeria phage vB_RpoP-V14]|uniref:Uncharacterized protein n=4 Tax=Aorunvirus V12 TaxID=2846074 RepID=A0A2Z4QGV5_9CAUD|nr:hypothetical protein HYP62_gp39 [Ruegeria phage vB_RpoP-V12]AWY08826.1 hypothetical protein vBRpoPV12_39 [Ruegeria phage vB_RpoP-V12]AWY08996.1 hypothetical protein vBRpoPV21_38 [Ruegeria phage vB_RpoP-V21]AWY09557.1 hypothetical protein vBRpoPV17_38 [Ruegeria phage vB_RpoP-V17]AXF42159.1 hypothetical protein vBRpoPV14_41 [Ruegeria phage vB_RpoP-V14]